MKQKATWIWYPGDFEVWLGNKFNNRRTERGTMFPPFWKQDSHWPTVVFSKTVKLEKAEKIDIFCEGQLSAAIDGKLVGTMSPIGLISPISPIGPIGLIGPISPISPITIPAGEHTLSFKVWNQASPPALFVKGRTIVSDSSWKATYEDKIWIDENGEAHGSGIYVPVGVACNSAVPGSVAHFGFDNPEEPPSHYRLPTTRLHPVSSEKIGPRRWLYDFGRETFGSLRIGGLRDNCTLRVYYGESREEALDGEHCETLDACRIDFNTENIRFDTKAFRYVCVERTGKGRCGSPAVDYEYAPFDPARSGSFCCDDEELNRIWQVAAYTLDLTTREFFCDGIKRDRWTWSGDAIQSYLMNYYLRFDNECVKRTIRQLRGKDPVTAHVNTIMDYTFYWFKSIADYYEYTGDLDFIREMWPKMVSLMDYVLARTNSDGMAEGRPDDWIFVDWVDFPMHKRGALAFEQILLWKALETMALCSRLLATATVPGASPSATVPGASPSATVPGALASGRDYAALAAALRERTKALFFSPDRSAFLHALEDGKLNPQVTKFPNIFAIIYDFASEEEKALITKNVLLNPDIPAITTPYMRFYELEALCQMGQQDNVLQEMKAYWGGMLREGATTFWEKYNPEEHGIQHLAMYGRPYGKSLCHAWGASPLYIIGRYFLGVRPTKPGYEEYEVRPHLGGLKWMRGDVPTPSGIIHVEVTPEGVKAEMTPHAPGLHGVCSLH